jgi:hypothetical protein
MRKVMTRELGAFDACVLLFSLHHSEGATRTMQETATAPPLIAGWPSPALLVESTQSVQRCPLIQRSGALALGRSA